MQQLGMKETRNLCLLEIPAVCGVYGWGRQLLSRWYKER